MMVGEAGPLPGASAFDAEGAQMHTTAAPGPAVRIVPTADAAPVGPEASAEIRAVTRASLDDMKAEDTVEIDLVGRTSIADAMFITSGRSNRHVGSIAEKLVTDLKERGFGRIRVEGLPACDWVLIDAGDIIVHVFRPEVRGFYNLEKMWGVDRPLDQAAG